MSPFAYFALGFVLGAFACYLAVAAVLYGPLQRLRRAVGSPPGEGAEDFAARVFDRARRSVEEDGL